MSNLKKCEKCGQGYYAICLGCITIYEPPPELSGGQPRYGEVGKSLFSQGRPHPPKETSWMITLNGVQLFEDVEPDMLPLLHWYVPGEERLTAKAGLIANVNPYHRRKATSYPESWTMQKIHIERALELIASGEALETT